MLAPSLSELIKIRPALSDLVHEHGAILHAAYGTYVRFAPILARHAPYVFAEWLYAIARQEQIGLHTISTLCDAEMKVRESMDDETMNGMLYEAFVAGVRHQTAKDPIIAFESWRSEFATGGDHG